MSNTPGASRWNEIFSHSRIDPTLFYVRKTRGMKGQRTIPDRIETLLMARRVPHCRATSRGVSWGGWRQAGFAFLDGGYTSTLGDGFPYGGAYVVGFASFRFICAGLGLIPPRLLKGETVPIPTTAQLEAALRGQLLGDGTTLLLDSASRGLCHISDYLALKRFASGRSSLVFTDSSAGTDLPVILDSPPPEPRAHGPKVAAPDPSMSDTVEVRDPLAGRSGNLVSLAGGLDDEEIQQFIAYWQSRHDHYVEVGYGYSAWWCTKHVGIGRSVQRVRRALRGE